MKKKKTKAQFRSASDIIKRVIQYMLHYYKIPFLLVIVCILITAVAEISGRLYYTDACKWFQ